MEWGSVRDGLAKARRWSWRGLGLDEGVPAEGSPSLVSSCLPAAEPAGDGRASPPLPGVVGDGQHEDVRHGADTRTTIYLDVDRGFEDTDVSGDIARTCRSSPSGSCTGTRRASHYCARHASMGVTAPATRWFLAEGATGTFFDLFVLFANPSATAANLRVDYPREDASAITRDYVVRAHSRFTVFVNCIPGLTDTSVATTVTSTNNVPIVVDARCPGRAASTTTTRAIPRPAPPRPRRRWVVRWWRWGSRHVHYVRWRTPRICRDRP